MSGRLLARVPWRACGVPALVVIALAIPFIFGKGDYRLSQYEDIGSLILVAIGLDIVTGFAGQLSLGPGAVFAIAAYGAIVFANHFPADASLPLLCLIGAVLAAVAGLIAGMPALRVGGFYLGMTTLFLALLVPTVASQLSWTGGEQGISLVSNLGFIQSPSGIVLYEIMVLVILGVGMAAWATLYSRLGHRLLALRTSEDLAASLGVSAYRTKLLAFVLSSVPAGIGGAFYVYTQQFMSPDSATPNLSIYLLAGCVIGGFGTVVGPIIGTAIVLSLSVFLGSLNQYQGIVFGVVLIVVIRTIPDGIIGTSLWRRILDRLLRRSSQAGDPESDEIRITSSTVESSLPPPLLEFTSRGVDESPAASLVIRDAGKSFGGVVALDGVDLMVRPGTIHALIGPNGSGKTTLLNLISGFYRLDRGAVEVAGERVNGRGPARVARHGIGRTFQTPKLLTDKDVRYNVLVAADFATRATDFESVFRLPRGRRADREAGRISEDCLRRVGLTSVSHVQASNVSHGMQRLVEVARVMALRPTFYLLDEPAAGLSHYEVEVMKTVVRDLAASGAGILLVEHNLPLVFDLADEVTVLHRGRTIARGSPSVIASNEEVARVYLGREVAKAESAPE